MQFVLFSLIAALTLLSHQISAQYEHQQYQYQQEDRAPAPPSWRNFYIDRYRLSSLNEKLVDNFGAGFDPLYGVRNFRQVIPGVVYRGGANNTFNREQPRSNQNPIPGEDLSNLCQEGFSTVIYLYSTNYDTVPHAVDCGSVRGMQSHLEYRQKSAMDPGQATQILKIVSNAILGHAAGPIYLHCWNGWHASGFISALILRQFCDFSGDQAVAYWDKNTDGHSPPQTFNRLRERLRNFIPDPSLNIPVSLQSEICPLPN